MAMHATVELIGILGSDPEMGVVKNGGQFLHFMLATTDCYKDQATGSWQDRPAVWHKVFVFSMSAKRTISHFRKGHRVKVIGALSYQETVLEIDGEKRRFRDALINARHIEPAPLSKEPSSPEAAEAGVV